MRAGRTAPHRLQTGLVLKPVRAASPHCLEAALVLGRCGLPARTGGSSFGAQRPLPARTACKHLGVKKPLRAASPHRSATLWKAAFGAQRLLRAASPHHLEAALVL